MTKQIASHAASPLLRDVHKDSRQALKRALKGSHFIVGAVRALRGLGHDARVAAWLMRRPTQIRRYFAAHPQRRCLHIGASHNRLDGWLNTDLDVSDSEVAYLDATRQFPFADGAFDHVMAEHMIEHIDYESGQAMLRECLRILKPGGRIRLATPDLRTLVELYVSSDKTLMQRRYVDWMVQHVLPGVDHCRESFVLNTAVRAWGHQFLYDQQSLRAALERTGYDDVRFYAPGQSDEPGLSNLESHGKEIHAEDINQFETIVAEGRKPLNRETGA